MYIYIYNIDLYRCKYIYMDWKQSRLFHQFPPFDFTLFHAESWDHHHAETTHFWFVEYITGLKNP